MVMVVGCGNMLCADDGVGVAAVRALEAGGVPDGVRVIEAGCPGLGLLDLIAGAERLILVDAVITGAPPGTLHRFGPGVLPPREALPLSLHGFNLVDALALGFRVIPAQMPVEIVIFGVEIAERTSGCEGFSAPVAVALPGLVEAIRRELTRGES